MEKILNTPVLFLVFNRPEKTERVFNVIRQVKPSKLYVAADAPRSHNHRDIELCNKVRKIVKNIDWDCDAHYLFQDKNLGCSLAGKTAWDWFFSQEEEMIFIEDDGLPSLSFFYYCQEMLEYYRNNDQIAYIGGTNYGMKYGDATYFFTMHGVSTVGMATWKRVYDIYEYDLGSYLSIRKTKQFKRSFLTKFEYRWWIEKFDHYLTEKKKGIQPNTYDLQMSYLLRKYKLFCAYTNVNFVSHIGYDMEGSNTIVDPSSDLALRFGNKPTYEIDKIIHPSSIYINNHFEKLMFKERELGNKPIWKAKIRFYLKKTLRKMPFLYKINIFLTNLKNNNN